MSSPEFEAGAVRVGSRVPARIVVLDGRQRTTRRDQLAAEEPLEIRLEAAGQQHSLAITMRTPGADFELAAGFLLSEWLITQRDSIDRIRYCIDDEHDDQQRYNVVTVALRQAELPDLAGSARQFPISSSCGVCGRDSIDMLRRRIGAVAPGPLVAATDLYALPEIVQAHQSIFAATGGLHAAALFDAVQPGKALAVREDVGRHNALDKLIGWALLNGRLPLTQAIVLVSGRVSFEIVQKCAAAGVPILCAVSAPSSLAVATAREIGMTLVGFLRGQRANLYAGAERIIS
ncbi:MAG TPA: formate dehydrogenase accessory sulfurtransferase FdhD [Roseiflexaceae bacterium]|nr:formate dehydrogenase accessory sulfurtransferase FdhD [Roseiflexaceae bacterium]